MLPPFTPIADARRHVISPSQDTLLMMRFRRHALMMLADSPRQAGMSSPPGYSSSADAFAPPAYAFSFSARNISPPVLMSRFRHFSAFR